MDQQRNVEFAWQCYPDAANVVTQLLCRFVGTIPAAASLASRMHEETGTRLVDWVDHVCLPGSHHAACQLAQCGFESTSDDDQQVWKHAGGMFPVIRVGDFNATRLAIKTESVADFLFKHRVCAEIEGQPLSKLRMARVGAADSHELWVVQRHGSVGFRTSDVSSALIVLALRHSEALLRRKRDFDNDRDGFDHARELVRAAVSDLGVDWTCDLFFAAERQYWQSRNRAARVQKSRQDALGLGWANHDHHTYRSSRQSFARLISLLEGLGFQCRERFYGGAEAGWGAQVLEQPAAGIVVFADVDLTPTEVAGDFAHDGLPSRGELGTVGLWCRLHGEAMLQAGMHHLECQFDFDAARQQLAAEGITTMAPFTDFDHLKQAFTEGQVWQVSTQRIDAAFADGLITEAQATRFRDFGSTGSHLEILQRDDGYKGFNQTGISEIIRETDPRNVTDSGP
jgi:hypothetical protein